MSATAATFTQSRMQTLYQVLGVSEDATPEDIKHAFRKLSMEFHPDRNPGNPAAEARFREALDAYKVLSDPEKRYWYDREGDYVDEIDDEDGDTDGQAAYEQYRKERTYTTENRIAVVIGLILIIKLIANAFSNNFDPEIKIDAYKFTQPQKLAELDSLADEKLTLRNGDTLNYLDWEKKLFAEKADIKRGWSHMLGDDARLLQISATYKYDQNGTEDWIFREDPGKGLVELLHHNGAISLNMFQLRLRFGYDVDTFRSCKVCNMADLPHQDITGIFLHYQQGALSLSADGDRADMIRENLVHLASRDAKMLTPHSDNGLRKEYLRQFLTWHFLHADLQSTLQLFNTQYRYPDSKEMWSSITGYIQQYEMMLSENINFKKDEGL